MVKQNADRVFISVVLKNSLRAFDSNLIEIERQKMDKDKVIRILTRIDERYASLYREVVKNEMGDGFRNCTIMDALEILACYYERWYEEYHIDSL